jgi:hypothetical protein
MHAVQVIRVRERLKGFALSDAQIAVDFRRLAVRDLVVS